MIPETLLSPVEVLARRLRQSGPIPCLRVSSAPSVTCRIGGREASVSYWGIAEYEIGTRVDGLPTIRCTRRAERERRSYRACRQDARELAQQCHRHVIDYRPGPVNDAQASEILGMIG